MPPAILRIDPPHRFVRAVSGIGKNLGLVATRSDFDPAKPQEASRAPFPSFHLKPDGSTDDTLLIWSGDTLMNLRKNEALKMRIEPVNGTEYLFIEIGGFQTKNGMNWKSPLCVMKRP